MIELSPEEASALRALQSRQRRLSVRVARGTRPEGIILMLQGDLDRQTSSDFTVFGIAMIGRAEDLGSYNLELSGLKYVSSAGIGALVTLLSAIETRGLQLRLFALQPRAFGVFRALGIDSFFEIVDGACEAE